MKDKRLISYEDAIALLPDKERIHTFRNGGIALLGADWDRSEILDQIREHGAELAGVAAAAMGHGLYSGDGYGGVFIEADKAKISAFDAKPASESREEPPGV